MPQEPLNASGPRIREIRRAQGMTQDDLAAKCQLAGLDYSRFIITNIERQKREVKDREMLIIAKILSVPPGELLE